MYMYLPLQSTQVLNDTGHKQNMYSLSGHSFRVKKILVISLSHDWIADSEIEGFVTLLFNKTTYSPWLKLLHYGSSESQKWCNRNMVTFVIYRKKYCFKDWSSRRQSNVNKCENFLKRYTIKTVHKVASIIRFWLYVLFLCHILNISCTLKYFL